MLSGRGLEEPLMRERERERERNRNEAEEPPPLMAGTDMAVAVSVAFFVIFVVIASGCLALIYPVLEKIYRSETQVIKEKDAEQFWDIWSIIFRFMVVGIAWMGVDFLRRYGIINRFSNWISGYWHGYQPIQ